MIIKPKVVSKKILERIDKNTYVHSIFENGVNIVGKNCLIFITHEDRNLSPNSILLFKDDFKKIYQYLNIDMQISLKDDKIINPKFVIKLDIENSIDLSINSIKNKNIKEYGVLKNYIEKLELMTGFGLRVKELNKDKHISSIKQIVRSNNNAIIEDVLKNILGKGKGLTPSGDDFLIGLLWANEDFTFLSDTFKETLLKLLYTDITTDISKNYLKMSLIGEYSSSLIKLYESLSLNFDFRNIIKEILDYGHTSGIDTLSGIYYGIEEGMHENSISIGGECVRKYS